MCVCGINNNPCLYCMCQRLTKTADHDQVSALQKENELIKVEYIRMYNEGNELRAMTLRLNQEYENALHNATHSLKADLKDAKAMYAALLKEFDVLSVRYNNAMDKIKGFSTHYSDTESQVENLIEENKVLRAAIATIGSIVKVAEQL